MEKKECLESFIDIAINSGIQVETMVDERLDTCVGWNSINLIKLIVECEKKYGVKFDIKSIMKTRTINEVINLLIERMGKDE